MKAIHKLAALTALTALLGTAPTAQAGYADDVALNQLANQLRTVAVHYTYRDYYIHDFEPTFLERGTYKSYWVSLNRGESIIVRGMGDRDSHDIDVGVFTSSGRAVAKDVDYDANPCVQFVAPYTGRFEVQIALASCASRTNGCYVAVLIAEK